MWLCQRIRDSSLPMPNASCSYLCSKVKLLLSITSCLRKKHQNYFNCNMNGKHKHNGKEIIYSCFRSFLSVLCSLALRNSVYIGVCAISLTIYNFYAKNENINFLFLFLLCYFKNNFEISVKLLQHIERFHFSFTLSKSTLTLSISLSGKQ